MYLKMVVVYDRVPVGSYNESQNIVVYDTVPVGSYNVSQNGCSLW